MNLYELFKYKEKEILELEYLLEQGKRFGIEDKIQEAFFQFSPKLLEKEEQIEGFGEHEPWSFFHKRMVANEIIYYLIEKSIEDKDKQEEEIDNHIWEDKYALFIIKNDFRKLTEEEIISLFKKEI